MAQQRYGLKLSLSYFGDDWFRLVLQSHMRHTRTRVRFPPSPPFGLSVVRLEESELYRAFVALGHAIV